MTLAILFLAYAGALGAEEATSSEERTGPPPPVSVEVPSSVEIVAGDSRTVTITVSVEEGHRVQANPASNEFLVPVELRFDDLEDISFGPPSYPPGVPYRLEGAEEDLSTYVGTFEISLPAQVSADAAVARHLVAGTLHFQACNSRMCLFPESVPVEIEVVITRP